MKKSIYSAALSLLLISSAVATRPGLSGSPAIHIQPETALADEVVSIRLSGLKPNQAATIKATMPSSHGHVWKSHAEFIADKNGSVDLSKQAPARGAYTGVDAMGLFWSMERVAAEGQQAAAQGSFTDPVVMKFELEVEGKTVASANLTRLSVKPDVKAVDVRDDGLVAKLYYPGAGGPHPGIIVIGGSEGGIQSAERGAALFASHGYAALAVAYFGMESLPKRLVEVPIDYMKKAIDWMGKREGVDASRLAIMGGSKGGELALLLASRYSEIKAVVAYVPSHVVWQGIGGGGSSWSYEGKPLPYVPYKPGVTPTTRGPNNQMVIAPLYLASLDDKEAVEKATIPVENINGPVLLISGKSDDLWPSSLMGDMVIARLKKYNHKHKYEHLSYESAGHSIGTTYRPTTASMGTGTLALGGTPVANARAQADSWPKVLKFLSESTRKNNQPPAPITSETIKNLENLMPQ